jgi:protoporphyrinogen oxidase
LFRRTRMTINEATMPTTADPKRRQSAPRHVVIIGAGPAGLTAAYELHRHGAQTTVLERDPRYVGGIARTIEHKGYRLDIGGHRFYSKNQEINDLWTEILGGEMLVRDRLSRIYYRGKFFDYPLKAANALSKLGLVEAARCLTSYAWAWMHRVENPRTFEEWVTNQFGRRLFKIFFKTYTEKVWGMSTNELTADWAAQRISDLNLGAVIRNTLMPGRSRGRGNEVPKTLIDEFRYPRRGPGQMWERMRDLLRADDHELLMGQHVVSIRHDEDGITQVVAVDESGATRAYHGTHFISTMPIRELVNSIKPALPEEAINAADGLRYRDFLTVFLMVNRDQVFPDNWIYVHDPSVKVGRIQNFKNWSPEMVPEPSTSGLGLEYFCLEGDGLWTMSDQDLIRLAAQELATLGICSPNDVFDGLVVRQPKAYPVYDAHYKENVETVRRHLERVAPNLWLVGRNGMHRYNNQDHSMMTAILAARNIVETSDRDPWKVNGDAEYLEGAELEALERSGRLVPLAVAD